MTDKTRLTDLLCALQASPDGMLLLDGQGRMQWCNHMAEEHFGLRLTRDKLQPIVRLISSPDFQAWHAAGDFTQSVVLTGKNSSPSAPVRLSVHLHPYGRGRLLLLSRNITALEQADAMRRDFVANVSHEIRTPLTVLMGFVETLQTLHVSDAERAHYLTLMAGQAQRMHLLVQDLLTLSRLEGSPLPGVEDRVSVAALLRHCESEAHALSALLTPDSSTPQRRITFPSAKEARAAGHIAGSAGELQSALTNLVSNAVRYTPAGGVITVTWQTVAGGGARINVSDTGPGIAAEHLPRITERFYRVDRSRSRHGGVTGQGEGSGGTGLGLAIVKHVVQRHGGILHIHSVVGQGSTFAVEFPAERIRR